MVARLSKIQSHSLEQKFLNQARAGHRLLHMYFLKIVYVRTSVCVCMFVCICLPPSSRLLINNDVIRIFYDWLNKFCDCYLATVVDSINGRGFGIDIYNISWKLTQ